MKTPWKFLSNLVSRKPPEDRESERVSKAPDMLAVEHFPAEDEKTIETAAVHQPDEEAGMHSATPEANTDDKGSADVVEENVDPVETPLSVSAEPAARYEASLTSAPLTETNTDQSIGSAATAPQARKSVRSALAGTAPAPVEPGNPPEAKIAKTIHEEMLSLDEEIAELRHLLSKKLVLQNAYLKSMLDRYIQET
jgi:hypothetical protein